MLDPQHRCIRCGAPAPESTGESTLISTSGWRVRREAQRDGTLTITLYCPACWAAHKRATTAPSKL